MESYWDWLPEELKQQILWYAFHQLKGDIEQQRDKVSHLEQQLKEEKRTLAALIDKADKAHRREKLRSCAQLWQKRTRNKELSQWTDRKLLNWFLPFSMKNDFELHRLEGLAYWYGESQQQYTVRMREVRWYEYESCRVFEDPGSLLYNIFIMSKEHNKTHGFSVAIAVAETWRNRMQQECDSLL